MAWFPFSPSTAPEAFTLRPSGVLFLVADFPGSAKGNVFSRVKGEPPGREQWLTSALTLGFEPLDSSPFFFMAPSSPPTGAASPVVLWPHHRQKLFSWFPLSWLRKADFTTEQKALLHSKVEIIATQKCNKSVVSQAQWGLVPALQGQANCGRCPAPCSSSPGFTLPVNPSCRVTLCSVLGILCFYHKHGNCTLPWFPQMPKHV